MLLHGRRRELALQLLDERRDVDRLHGGQLIEAVILAPRGEAARCVEIGFASVVIVNLRGEEFHDALRRLWRRREQPGRDQAGGGGDDELAGGELAGRGVGHGARDGRAAGGGVENLGWRSSRPGKNRAQEPCCFLPAIVAILERLRRSYCKHSRLCTLMSSPDGNFRTREIAAVFCIALRSLWPTLFKKGLKKRRESHTNGENYDQHP